jgi:rhomboid protease GluP
MEREKDSTETTEDCRQPVSPERITGNVSSALSMRQADLWALVLESRDIPCMVTRSEDGWALSVPAGFREAAEKELRLFEEENRNWPPPEPRQNPLTENTIATLSVLLLLATFHNITLLNLNPPIDWIALGSADSAKILAGQWWRAATALTLHAGWLHLLGNLTIGGVFIILLCRELGSGLAWTLLLGSGILGNLANAFMQPFDHDSIGASTLVFGAVGILAASTMLRQRNNPRKRRLLPIAAALGLLALLGTEGKNTDLGAHFSGFAAGIVLGLAAEYLAGKYGRPGRIMNASLSILCAMTVAVAWWAALAFGM